MALTSPTLSLAVVSHGVTPYGVHFLRRVARELSEFHLETIYSTEWSMGRWNVDLPTEIHATVLGKGETSALPHDLGSLWRDLRRGADLIRTVRRSDPAAVVIFGYSSLAHVMTAIWCRRHSVPCLMWADSNIRGDLNLGLKAIVKRTILGRLTRSLAAILVCGRLGAQYFARYGAASERVFFVPNEPDYSLIENAAPEMLSSMAAQFGLASTRRRLLYAGRLVPVKRVDLLIDAFSRVADDRPDWDLVIVGGGPLEAALRRRVPESLVARTIWIGFEPHPARMAALFRLADVLVLPSDREPWGLVVNEAACAGLALVCSDVVGAATELLHDGENGRAFPSGCLAPLTAVLLDATDDANLSRYRAASPRILAEWRRTTDPIDGLRRALHYCLTPRSTVCG